MRIKRLIFFVIAAAKREGEGGRRLGGVVGGEGDELMRAPYASDQFRRTVDPANLPAGHAEGFAGAADGHRALEHAIQRGNRHMLMPFEVEMLVDFIGDDDDIVLDAEIGE